MKILCVSKDATICGFANILKREGHEVRLFVDEENERVNLEGMIEKVADWKKELSWVGKEGIVIFDSIGYGKTQDELRADGYLVVGGCEMGDRLEHDRQYGQKILSSCGIKIVPSINFLSAEKAIEFLKEHTGPWVIKQNGHVDKAFNYVGELENNEDAISLLENYCKNNKEECNSIDIQKRIFGVEIGVGRYFNGKDWIGPIEINQEHKSLFSGNIGPKTYEMGTLMWYTDDENNPLFKILNQVKPYLEKIKFHGDFEINSMVNEEGIFPLEITARFGFPAVELQNEIHETSWGEFLQAVAKGEQIDFKFKKGFGVIALVAIPPFPYQIENEKYSPDNLRIFFKENLSEEELAHIPFQEVSRDEKGYYVSGKNGYVLHVSGFGETVEGAREKIYKLIEKIVIPKMFYRNDIGLKFIEEEKGKLEKWGWI